MEGPGLFLLIVCLLAGSVSCYEARCLSSRCQWNNVHFLNCRSTGITTLGDLFFLDQETRNVTSSNHLQRCLRTTKDIDLSYNLMSALYLNVFYKFVSLETLNITNNQIYRVSLNKNGKQHEKGAFLTSLQTLVLNGNRLIAIPKGLCKLKSLQTLNLSANRILYIQRDDFANCTELQHVDLGENRISNIHPEAFRDLRNLQVLKLHSNTLVSLSPLVFLFKHVLKADIDLSDNLWACDCRLQPLKYFISSLSTGVQRPWNVTCSTPFSKAGQHILSIENRQSCQKSDYSFTYDKTLLITVGEEASLDCGSSNQLGNTDVLWWTPHGIISKEKQNGNYYLSDTNSLILNRPDDSDEGLYLCLTNAARTTYQVGIQVNNLKTKRRSPRDLQLKNARLQTQSSFDLAVSLSVILTFLVAFCLGVFLRPYLESLWRKGCKSKDTETQHSNAVYENEGFTADYTTRKYGENRNVSSLSQYETRQTLEKPDEYNLEAENITGRQERAIDVQIPTYNAVEEMREDMNKLNQRLPKTKRVKWAINEDLNFNVNLKYYMSLLKPIHFIVLDSSMPDMVYDHQSHSTNSGNSDNISVHKHNKDITEMMGDCCSSDEGSSFSLGSEYDNSDDDSIINAVLQETKQETQDSNDNASLRINLKHVISLLKPVHFIVPDSTVPTIVKSPRQKQLFPLGISEYPENRMENVDNSFKNHLQGSEVVDGRHETHSLGRVNKHKKNKQASKTLYDTCPSDESSIYSFDSEYELSDVDETLKFRVLGRTKSNKPSNENDSFTVNLKFVMSSLKPINIIVPELTTVTYSEPQLRNTSRIHYTVALNDSSTSDEESKFSVNSKHYFSAEDAFIDTNVLKNQTRSANETLSPTVNLKHVISLLKPIKITFPDSTIAKVIKNSTQQLFPSGIPRYPENLMENADISSNEHNKDKSLPLEQSECQLQSTNLTNQYAHPKKAIEVTQPVYDSSSSEDNSNDSDDSDKAVIGSPILNTLLPRKWGSNENIYPTVSLRQVISTLKPIKIKVPDVTHYSATISPKELPSSPKEDFKVTSQKLYYYSSSDEHSNDSKDDSSDEFENRSSTLPVPPPRKRADSEKVYTSVNLKHIISSLKPIHIHMPGSTQYTDTLLIPKKDIEVNQNPYEFRSSESSSDSADSEHESSYENIKMSPNVFEPVPTEWKTPLFAVTKTEWSRSEDLTPTVNLKQLISSFKPIHINIPDTAFNLDIPVKKATDVAQKLYDFSFSDATESGSSSESADSEHEGSDEDVIQSNYSPELKTEWKNHDYPTSTVNLKHLISSLKPIRIDIPGSPHHTDTLVTPKKDTEVTQNLYEFSSSDHSEDSDNDSSDEFVNRDSTLPVPPPRRSAGSEKVYTTVNLKHIISSLKPFPIHMPGSTHYTDTLVTPKKDTEVTQNPYEFSSSESSNDSADSEHESSYEEIIMSPNVSKQMPTEWKTPVLFAPTATEWASSEDLTPTLNLKQVICSFKPIRINSPDTTINSGTSVKKDTDVAQKLYNFTSSDTTESGSSSESADSEHEGSDEEVIQSNYSPETKTEWKNHDYPTSTVNLKHLISSLKPIHIDIPGSPHYSDTLVTPNKNTEVTQNPYEFDSSESSNDSDHDSSDEFVNRSSTLPVPPPKKRAGSEKVYTNVNLKHIISSLKPIQIHMPGSTHYTDTLVNPEKDTEVTQNPYDSSSSESSNDSDHDRSDEFVNRSSTLPVPPPRKRADSEKFYTSVNLKHIMSSLKPIRIHMPGSTHYTDTLLIPKKDTDFTQNAYEFRSSESTSDSADSEHESSYEEIKMSPNVSEQMPTEWKTPALFAPTRTEWESNEDLTPTVNLRQLISSFKPIHINIPDTTVNSHIPVKKDTDVAQKLYDFTFSDTTESGSSSESADSEHEGTGEEVIQSINSPETKTEWKNHDYPTSTVNLKHLISSLKPIHIDIPGSPHYTDTLVTPKKNTEVTQNPYEFSSSESSNDSDHDSSDEFVNRSSTLPVPPPRKRANSEKVYTSVNLKHIISSLKPIPIHIPGSPHYTDTLVTLEKNTEVTQNPYDISSFESSNDSDHDSSDEYVNRSSTLPVPPPRRRAGSEKVYTSVNLKHIISSLKPFPIHMPGSTHYTNTLVTPKKDTEFTQNLYEFSSSESSSDSTDSEHESSYEEIIMSPNVCEQMPTEWKTPALFAPTAKEWASSEDLTPTLNLKQVISSFKPIHINSPDTTVNSHIPVKKDTDVAQKLYDFTFSDTTESGSSSESADSEHEGSDEEVIQSINSPETKTEWKNHDYPTSTVNLKHLISSLKPIHIDIPGSPHYTDTLVTPNKDTEVTKNPYEFSSSESSNDSDHDSSDEFVNRSSTLPVPPPRKRANSEKIYTSVNLKHIISSLKPIQIHMSGSTHYTDTLVTPEKDTEVTQNPYKCSSSESSNNSDHDRSDEFVKRSSTLPVPPPRKRAGSEKVYTSVNLKHIISSLKPFPIHMPGSTHYTDNLVTPKKYTEVTQNPYEFDSSESSNDSDHDSSDEFVNRSSTLPVPPPRKRADNEKVYSSVNLKHIISSLKPIQIHMPGLTHYTDTLVTPKKDTEFTQNLYEFSSSESSHDSADSEHESSYEEIKMSPNVSEPVPTEWKTPALFAPTRTEWESNEDRTPTVNLRQLISSFKPIHINIPDTTINSHIPVKKDTDVAQKLYNFTSSDTIESRSSSESADSEHECSDDNVKQSITLPAPITEWKNHDYPTPTVNLKYIMSSLKPIHIKVPDTVHYSITLFQQNTNAEDDHKLYDSTSSDESPNGSFDLNHEDSNKEVIKGTILPELAAAKGATNENLAPIVNLKHIISSLKPIHIKVPDSIHYSDTVINPKKNIEVTTQKQSDYGSSDESSNYLVDSDHKSSDEDVERRTNIHKLIPTTRTSNENISSTVNLRCIISTFKPLNITVADSTKYSDTLMSLNTDTEIMQKQYGNILSGTIPNYSNNSISEGSKDITILNLAEPVSKQLSSNEKDYPTVNFKNLMKPLHIKLQDSPNNSDFFIIPQKTVEVSKKPHNGSSSDESSAESGHEGSYEVTNQRIHINSSTDEDSSDSNSSEVEDSHEGILLVKHSTLPKPTPTEWARNEDLSPTVNFRHIPLLKPITFEVQGSSYHSDPLKIPKKNIKVTQKEYDYSSHDDTSADSEHEDPDIYVTKSSFLHNRTPTERTTNENSYPTLNLRHVISTLKPIKIRVSESNQYEDTSMTSKKNILVTSKTGNDINLSDKHSNYFANSKHEGTDEYVARTEWARNEHVYPTVNLKHVAALVKPIRIKVPDSIYYSDALRSSKINKVTAEKHFDHSSSDDESSKDSSDLEHEKSNENMMRSKLAKPMLTEWARTEMAYPTVNPTNVTPLPKPISIMAPDSAVPEVVKRPKWKSFFSNSTSRYKENQTENVDKYQPISYSFSQPRSPEHNKNPKHQNFYTFNNPIKNTNVILTSYKKTPSNDTSYNIDDWGHKGLNKSNTTTSDLLKSKMAAQASGKDDAPEVNLKHVMSLIKPIRIIAPELQMTQIVKHPPHIHSPPKESSKRLQEQLPSSFYEKPMAPRLPEQHSTVYKDLSQRDLIQFQTDSSEEDAL